MNEEDVNVKALEQKATYFYKESIPIHVKFKRGFWKRGYILEVGSDFFMMKEFIEGEMPVFFLEIKDIEKFNENKEVKENEKEI